MKRYIRTNFMKNSLRQANIDAIEFFIEFEFPFPKGEFLADDWKDLLDGVSMGIDSDFEVAEGIIEYLQKEVDFNNKHAEIYDEDPLANLTLEIYNDVKKEYRKAISYTDSKTIVSNKSKITVGNSLTNELPPSIDQFLQDLAQQFGYFTYSDIMNHKFTNSEINKLKYLRSKIMKLMEEIPDPDDEDSYLIDKEVNKVSSIIKSSVKENLRENYDRYRWIEDNKEPDGKIKR